MIKYLLASHGKFSEGTKSFLSIMVGDISNVYTLTAFLEEDSIDVKVKKAMEEIGDFDQLLVFCDIHGGSVAQEVYKQLKDDPRIKIIAGYNIALALDLICRGEGVTDDDVREAIEGCKDAIVYLNDYQVDDEVDNNLF